MSLDGNTQYLELYFYRNSYKAVKAKQYDKDTRAILVTCVNDASVYPLDAASMEYNLKLITPDGRAMLKSQTIQPDGTILIKLEETMLLVSGICKAELNILEQSTKKLLSTMNFDLIVIGSVYSNDIITSGDEFDALTDALLKIDDAHDLSERIQEAENVWIDNENERIQNEDLRSLDEDVRKSSETERILNESNRLDAEINRTTNEEARQKNETDRDPAETKRIASEVQRQADEDLRKSSEQVRIIEEECRKNAELLHNTSEEVRALAEQARDDNETIRLAAENNRTIEENSRLVNETSRIASESDRETTFTELKSSMDSATSKAEKVNIAALTSANTYQIKLTNRDGDTDTSPNLLNRISIGTVETGDSEEIPTATITGDFGKQNMYHI